MFGFGSVDQPNIQNTNQIVRISDSDQNPNDSTTERFWKAPKSKRSDFRHLLYYKDIFMYYKTV